VERLYASWRHAYVTRSAAASQGCVFCDAQSSSEAAALIVHQGTAAFVILNLFPYNSGHLLVVPRRHLASTTALSHAELVELAELTQAAEQVLTEVYEPQGINVGMNLGRSAGAGVADHIHTHLVPRWTGDTNFMTVVGEVRVLPEEIVTTAGRLRPVFARVLAAR
jgi:ATP adenylyltransferase